MATEQNSIPFIKLEIKSISANIFQNIARDSVYELVSASESTSCIQDEPPTFIFVILIHDKDSNGEYKLNRCYMSEISEKNTLASENSEKNHDTFMECCARFIAEADREVTFLVIDKIQVLDYIDESLLKEFIQLNDQKNVGKIVSCPSRTNHGDGAEIDNNINKLIEEANFHYTVKIAELAIQCLKYQNDADKRDTDTLEKVENRTFKMTSDFTSKKVSFEMSFEIKMRGNQRKVLEFLRKKIWCVEEEDDTSQKVGEVEAKGLNRKFPKIFRGSYKNNKDEIKNHKDHTFKRRIVGYFEKKNCSVCKRRISLWGEPSFECSMCLKLVHFNCIKKVRQPCSKPATKQPTFTSGKELLPRHDPKQEISYYCFCNFQVCAHTGKTIYPFTTYFKCPLCNDCFIKKSDAEDTICLAKDEQEAYDEYKTQIDMAFDHEMLCNYNEDNYFNVKDVVSDSKPDFSSTIEFRVSKRKGLVNSLTSPGKRLKEDFTFHKLLGEGNYGTVFLANYKPKTKKALMSELFSNFSNYRRNSEKSHKSVTKDQPPVAIKIIRKDEPLDDHFSLSVLWERDCLFYEYPLLTDGIETFQDRKFLYYVMEFNEKGNLWDYMLKNKALPADITLAIGLELLYGLNFLHKKRYVYRDLKLENIMFDAKGHIKITDFGMVRANCTEDNLCETCCGTPDYIAPELWQKYLYDFKVDIWALGCCMFEIYNFRSPFQGERKDELKYKICTSKPCWPRQTLKVSVKRSTNDSTNHRGSSCTKNDFKADIRSIINKCLIKTPKSRPSAEELIKEDCFKDLCYEGSSNQKDLPQDATVLKSLLDPILSKLPHVDTKSAHGDTKREIDSNVDGQLSNILNSPDVRSVSELENKPFDGFDLYNKIKYNEHCL